MLKRKIESYLKLWYKGKYALLVDGARQVGKTFILKSFLEENFENVIYLNFIERKDAAEALSRSRNAADFILRLSTVIDRPLVPNKTAIFFDEVQELKGFDWVTNTKFLIEDNQYRFVFSGSLLGVELYDVASWPTGYLAHTTMYPLDFEEFLWANGVNQVVIDRAFECFEKRLPVDDFIHQKLTTLFSQYILVGGMPDAVNAFVESRDFNRVALAHDTIEQYNRRDIAQYASVDEKLKIKEIYNLLPEELNSKNKRFQLSDIQNRKRGENIGLSFAWLNKAGVAIPVYNTAEAVAPLRINTERQLLKLFHEDVGLLTFILMDPSLKVKILDGERDVNFGAIYENVACQLMYAHGFENLYYYNSKKNGEVDFLVERQGEVLPIEIKSGKDYKRHSALNNLLEIHVGTIPEALVFCNSNTSIEGKITYLPIYLVEFLRRRNRYLG